MKKYLILFLVLICGSMLKAQFINVANPPIDANGNFDPYVSRGCIWKYQGSSAKCYNCTQTRPDGTVCLGTVPCPPCFMMIPAFGLSVVHEDGTIDPVYILTLDPEGELPESIFITSATFVDEPDGMTVHYTEY